MDNGLQVPADEGFQAVVPVSILILMDNGLQGDLTRAIESGEAGFNPHSNG